MCGRYRIENDTEDEVAAAIDKVISSRKDNAGDIFPGDKAGIIYESGDGKISEELMKWGVELPNSKIIINTRAETAASKPMFSKATLYSRCVVPASLFYEWSADKRKFSFYNESRSVLFLAGIYFLSDQGKHFTILTTAANPSVSVVHSRMPLIIKNGDLQKWVQKGSVPYDILSEIPVDLVRESSENQISFFN
jgi:putative SOS response-associated peptidase YedK